MSKLYSELAWLYHEMYQKIFDYQSEVPGTHILHFICWDGVVMEIVCKHNFLTGEILYNMRNTIGWGNVTIPQAEKAVKNSLYNLVAFDGDRIIGIGRLVGDGALVWYIEDLIVIPEYQKSGIGTLIMEQLLGYVEKNSVSGSCTIIGLMSSKGQEPFYKKFGFRLFPNEHEGAGMELNKVISNLVE
jgi:GNAT superfamily N-acetyltransferase